MYFSVFVCIFHSMSDIVYIFFAFLPSYNDKPSSFFQNKAIQPFFAPFSKATPQFCLKFRTFPFRSFFLRSRPGSLHILGRNLYIISKSRQFATSPVPERHSDSPVTKYAALSQKMIVFCFIFWIFTLFLASSSRFFFVWQNRFFRFRHCPSGACHSLSMSLKNYRRLEISPPRHTSLFSQTSRRASALFFFFICLFCFLMIVF